MNASITTVIAATIVILAQVVDLEKCSKLIMSFIASIVVLHLVMIMVRSSYLKIHLKMIAEDYKVMIKSLITMITEIKRLSTMIKAITVITILMGYSA